MNDLNYFINKYKYSTLVYNNKCERTECVQYRETDTSFIWLINPNQEQINIHDIEKLDNINFFAHEIEGIWACILQDKNTKIFRAISSVNNEMPWYYSHKPPFIISNNIFLIAELSGLKEPNEIGIATFISFDHTFAGETFIKGITKSYGGSIITFNEKSMNIKNDNLEKWLGFDNSIRNLNILADKFIEEVDKSLRDKNPEITLTGGADSRIILAAGLKTKRKFKLMTGIPPSVDKLDINISTKIAKELNLEHIKTDASKRQIANLDEVLERMTIETNAEFIPRNWLIFYKEFVMDQDNLKHRSKLLGYGGEIFKGFYTNLTRTLNVKTNILMPNIKKNVFDNAMNIYNRYYKINKENSLNLFYQRERSHFWVPMNIRTTLSYCKCYIPLMSPSLLGLGYRVEGGIKNSNLHEKMLDSLPEVIKKLPSNYNKVNLIWKYLKRTYIKINIEKDTSLKPNFLRNNINFELFKNILTENKINNMIDKYESRGFNASELHKLFAISNFFKILNN